MDVFEALGLDLPDNTRSMSVTEPDPDLMSLLAPVFGWNEQEASANSLILFPHDSQQGFAGGGLLETPSVNGTKPNDQPGNSTTMGSQPTVPQGDVKPEPASAPVKVSPFSGISQFDLFLGDPLPPPAAATEPTGPTSAAGPSTARMVSPFVQPAGAVPDVVDMQLQSEFSQGLLCLLEEASDPTPQEQQQQLPADPPTASPLQQLVLQPPSAAMLQPPSSLLQQQPQQQGGLDIQQASTGAPAALPAMPQQQLVPPMLPPMMLRPPQQLLQQQQYGVLQQPQAVFQPLVSPLLVQAQQQHGGPPPPLRLPQVGQQLPLPVVQLSQQLLQQRQLKQQQQQQQMPFQQQQLLYQQQLQQQQQPPMDLHLPDADGSGDGEQDYPHHHAQPKRRGRPPKVPGQYSKGYEAIKRYREKKKGMVEHMEAEIALKREQLHKLQAEQEALRSHQVALESTMSNQDKLLAQMLQLKLSLAGKEDSKDDTDLEATTAAAMAGVQQALAMQNGGDAAAAQEAAAAAAAAGRQRLVVQQQRAQQKVLQEGPLFLRRYQAYVQAVADTLAREAAAAGASSSAYLDQAAIAATAAPFPTFPFTLMETLSLWQLSRLAIMTRTNVARHDEGGNTEVWDDFTLNLSSGQHDYVSQDYWKGVAGQIGLHGEQPQQLSAAWRLYANAMNALNEERQGLLLKLQAAAAAEEAADPPAAAGLHAQQQQQQLPGASSSGAGFLQGNVAPAAPGMLPAAAQLGQAAGSSCNNDVLAAQASSPGAAVAAAAAGGTRVNRLYGTQALDVAYVYMDLLDAVERNLLRGRAVIMMFGWSMLCMLSAEQIGRICVASWPYFPLMRAIVGYMLGKEDLVP